MFSTLLVVWLIFELNAAEVVNPCTDHKIIWKGYGYRSSGFSSYNTYISLCDDDLDKEAWYRFDFDAGTQLIETPVPPWHCGTQSPIWMNGSHPTSEVEVIRQACAVTSDNDCWWTGDASVKLCNQGPESYYVYKLAIPGGCALAYCVDAATQKQCQPPLIWLQDELRCGENVTKTTTVAPSSTTTPYRSTSHMLSTSTTPEVPTDWRSWGPWSSCSKPCDYGIQTRMRACQKLPCDGASSETQLCNKYNCKELDEEKVKGIIIEFLSSQNTMLTVVENEKVVNELMRQSINRICSANASLCCGVNIDGATPNNIVYITYSDIYTPQGYPKQGSGATVDLKVIAVLNTDTDHSVCKGNSRRISKRQSEPEGKKYISFEVMVLAATDCGDQINQETGLTVNPYKDPSKIQESDTKTHLSTACIIVIVIGCVIGGILIILLLIRLAVAVCKICCKKFPKLWPWRLPSYLNRKATVHPELAKTKNLAFFFGLLVFGQAGLPPVSQEK